jgi:hypothetical protein
LFSQKIELKEKLVDLKTQEPVVYANISFLNSYKEISLNVDETFSMNLDGKY